MDASITHEEPLLAEDLLLLLFDPGSGRIASEARLPRVLARALLADLVLQEHGTIGDPGASEAGQVHVSGGEPPSDRLLRDVWRRVVREPTGVRTLLDEVAPHVRRPLLDRLVDAGHIRRRRRLVGLPGASSLVDGGTWRRRVLLASLRPVLGGAGEGTPRTTALAGLLSASGGLPSLHPEIVWSRAVWARGAQLEQSTVVASTSGVASRPPDVLATSRLLLSSRRAVPATRSSWVVPPSGRSGYGIG